MKSSTLSRSNLSREKMAVLETLSNYKNESTYNESLSVYVRPNKEKELDLLWQNFKIGQKSEKSPSVYMLTGFIAGVVLTLLFTAIIGMSVRSDKVKSVQSANKQENVGFLPAGESSQINSENYTVQSGDTIESIMIRFYGSYDSSKLEAIKSANKIANINRLQIGQKLVIPMQ